MRHCAPLVWDQGGARLNSPKVAMLTLVIQIIYNSLISLQFSVLLFYCSLHFLLCLYRHVTQYSREILIYSRTEIKHQTREWFIVQYYILYNGALKIQIVLFVCFAFWAGRSKNIVTRLHRNFNPFLDPSIQREINFFGMVWVFQNLHTFSCGATL